MNDDDVCVILAAAVAQNTGVGGDGGVLRLARIGQELMRQRDARSEDFLRVAAELTALKAKLVKARAEVAEEIAQAIEATIDYSVDHEAERPMVDDEAYLSDVSWAAQIARDHGKDPD